MMVIPTPNQLDIQTCDKRCGLHEYSLTCGNLHALPFDILIYCAKQIIEITQTTRTREKLYILKEAALISRSVLDGGIFEFPNRVAIEMLLNWHFCRSEWIEKNPDADTNVINTVLDLVSVLELLENLHINANLDISPVLENLKIIPIRDLLI
ncbi:uncharacterized protein N7511_008460 [Penicillium nucicola]|uniref:uncharacterized protein n=1 Tax=Penicillium nucicola TaxID=1850975 RepID=UPI002545926E|nr:uncharacterized protein N7511_008460 [Penicillium nucicola]KAJ5751495.1 hypothetical protein N7511_008460 [Penicillium nucicola]